ncbi:MAG: CGNR zinc finger domain-containing protein [Acidobacteria bacterium]|nr:CGNR zinc finger domain-containing protein [Acidobacteriota bacterium]
MGFAFPGQEQKRIRRWCNMQLCGDRLKMAACLTRKPIVGEAR